MTTTTGSPLDKVRSWFEQPIVAHLATIMPDGHPTSVPLWVGLEGDCLAILTIPGTVKDRNIAREPRVALSLIAPDNPFAMASVRGRVIERIDGDGAWPIIDRIARKYTGSPYPERDNRIVFLITVENAWSHAF